MTIRFRKTRRQRKRITTRRQRRGGGILGRGTEGCVVDSLRCEPSGYVAKVFFADRSPINPQVQSRLAEIDPAEARFAQYHSASCEDVESNRDVLACGQGKPVRHVVLMKRLNPLSDPKKLTKAQFRYLRESLEILHMNGILHGDLPGNVMVDPMDGMPRIIDWGNSSIVPPSDPFLRHEMTHLVSGQFYKGVSDKD